MSCIGSWSYSPPVKFPYEEFDLSGVRTYPLASRKSKANAADFARPYQRRARRARRCSTSLPDILAGADFKAVVAAMRAAHATASAASSGASART